MFPYFHEPCMEFLCPWGNDIVSRLFGSVVLSPILSTQEPLEMETQPATESQVALSLGGTPTPVSPSCSVFCWEIGRTRGVLFAPISQVLKHALLQTSG